MRVGLKYLTLALLLATALTGCATPPQPPQPSERQTKAVAMFKERCMKAGEFIHRTVENVEGVNLLKLRPMLPNFANQFAMDDPYGRDLGGDGYIESFVRGSYQANHSGTPLPGAPLPPQGYLYVESVDPKDGVRYRYTGRIEEPWQTNKNFLKGYTRFVLDRTPATGASPRYGVTYEDISTREEREYWIAGSSLKVIDLQTNEVIAERIGYMVDYFQGSRAGGRSPWLFAADNACPSFRPNSQGPTRYGSLAQARQTQRFVEKVLHPITSNLDNTQ